ncbi:MAG: GAF domain-containing protein, partial [Verrucomicrobiaceae bacterium]
MSQSPALFRLFKMRLQQEPDVVLCRNRAKQVAEKFGFDRQDQIRIATAVSEIARNAFRYAKNASAEFLFETVAAPKAPARRNPQSLVCVIQDEGPGIPHLEEVLAGRYKSATGMGTGILGAHRLMDSLEVLETGPSGTRVRLEKGLPRGKSVSKTDLQPIVDSVAGPRQASPVEELTSQNHELLFMMEKVGEKSEELVRVNDELQETNRGVVALYDELDTIYRVGHVLASKLELDDLLQALIDATTEITGAEVGVFVYEDSDSDPPVRQHTAGILTVEFSGDEALAIHRVMHECPPGQAMVRFDDLEQESGVRLVPKGIVLRSYLAVPVVLAAGTQSGAMVFAHRSPGVFSERSERILASVALQATIGIENARLYKSVRSASAAKDEFLAILSHELRNPLNPIFARLSLLEEHPGMPREALEDIRLIRRNLELETRLIDDLLDMTRISRGKVIINREPVDLHEIIEAACHACSSYAVEEHIWVELKLEARRRTVRGDSVRLQQVFWNLVNNAVKFSSAGGMVVVRTWNEKENGQDIIRITVSDSGSGIAPSRTEIIFQPFEQ